MLGRLISIVSPLKPISDATQTGSGITNIKQFGPSGLYVENSGLYMRFSYAVDDLLTSSGGVLDENTMTMSLKDANGQFMDLRADQIIERNTIDKYIKFSAEHFSDYANKAEILQPREPSAVKPGIWTMYE